MATALALIASTLNLAAYIWYDRDLLRGTTRPNLSSWFVWVGITLLSVTSYTLGTGDWVKSALSLSVLAANIITIILILRRSRFSRLSGLDITAIVIGVIAGAVWLVSDSALWGNAVIQAAIVAGGIPTYRSVWLDPSRERPGPWLIWGFVFVLLLVVVLLRWAGKPLELLYPIIGVFLYGGVGLLALRHKPSIPDRTI
jgi:hypothetical protein